MHATTTPTAIPKTISTKTHQISVRLGSETDAWLEYRAGGKQKKAAFIRHLIEREMAQEKEKELMEMFNQASRQMDEEEFEEREGLLGGFAGAL